ncbi:hypothetical protein [uncultured Algimonas sp.]|uniref:hypothetical protein n=1 Tax=uncultured Algimonas sp. TaxID=1547920 RepID=UPI002632B954|nr:hypothetical protein [uncultured Algimonas sp.]
MPGPGPTDASAALEADIIRLAYSTAMDPSNLHRLLEAIETHVRTEIEDAEFDDYEVEDRAFRRIQRIETHLTHARDMLEARGGRSGDGLASRRSVLGDRQPAALLDTTGLVVLANEAAEDGLGLKGGWDLPLRPSDSHVFSRAGLEQLRKGCAALADTLVGQMVATLPATLLATEPDDPDAATFHLSLVRVSDEDGRALGRLGVVSIDWDEAVGARFQTALGLSDAQRAVTRAVVTGQSLQALAEARGRKLSTVRNQLKQVYARTGVGSQVQLASLYSGYAQLSRYAAGAPGDAGSDPVPAHLSPQLFRRPDGRRLHVDQAGPASGDPVLFFHAIVTGHTITPELDRALRADNIRLIMPWRPGWAMSDPHPAHLRPRGSIDHDLYAADIAELLVRRGIDALPALADNMGGIHAMATIDALRRRGEGAPDVTSLIWASPSFAVRRMRDMLHISPSTRSYFVLGRYARPLLDAYVRFAFAKMDAGFDEEHIRSVYRDSPRDLDLLARPGLIEALRENTERCRGETLDAYVEDLNLEISPYDWMDRLTHLPIHALVGDEYLATGEDWPRRHAERHADFTYEMVPETGSLLHLARPRLVTQALRRRIDATHRT